MKNVLLYFAIETPKSLASPTKIRALGEALQELDQELIPDRYGYTDHKWKRFDPAAAEEQLRHVHADHTSVVLRFRSPLTGYISLSASRGPRVPYNGAHIFIDYSTLGHRLPAAIALVNTLVRVFDAAYACGTLTGGNSRTFYLDDPKKNWGEIDGVPLAPSRPTGLSSLPGICWLNVFGHEYIEFFGRAHLQSTPAYKAEFINGEDRFWLQTTEHPEKAITSEGMASAEQIKQHLGHPKAFYGHDPNTPCYSATYETPLFDFTEIRPRLQGA